jgi:hypothetical protein
MTPLIAPSGAWRYLMLARIKNFVRGALFAIAVVGLSGAPLLAQASGCPENATGGQTGQPYRLRSQSLVTETRTVQVSTGSPCLVGGSATVETQEQYNVGYYQNLVTDALVKVDCRTGQVI